MKKIHFHAYMKENLGDDLFVLTMLRRYPTVHFSTQAEKQYARAFRQEANLQIRDLSEYSPMKKNLLHNRIVCQFRQRFCYDAFVKIGGSLFMEPKNWKIKKPFPKWQSRLLNGNKYIIGANFGPYYTDAFHKRAWSSLKYYRGVSFRDQYSYQLFRDIPQVQYAPDVIFGYPWLPERKQGQGVGISVIRPERKCPEGLSGDAYYATLAAVCDKLIGRGIPVSLFSFCKEEGDEEAIESILRRMDQPERVRVCRYAGDIPQMLDQINDCEYLMAGRFHAMILGFAMDKRVLPILYSPKQKTVLQDVGFAGAVWDLQEENPRQDPDGLISACLANPEISNLSQLKKHSETHFFQLDLLLK